MQNQGYQALVNQPKQALPNVEAPASSNLEALMEKLLKAHIQLTERVDQISAHNKMLENQLANQASTSSTKVTGKLPASTENPREHMNAITTRSGKQLLDPPYPNSEQFVKKNLEAENEKVNEDVIAQDKEDEIQEIEPVKKHRRSEDRETVAVSEECSALIQNKLLPKLRDPGSFSIPCVIGGSLVERALCDLWASVTLMPYSLCQKL
ncbi:PREDICTED: uncharacterized protein LOC109184332 [Ipomoea nil]|uniref:uncharacterized protein LOC109184332 n=1 Tax=Ipomoea nil TaxID=35883 RepID=UPI0009019264|nr:PREDICTED: uncharacterized protein LOC109184332 [Ipomoea nil]